MVADQNWELVKPIEFAEKWKNFGSQKYKHIGKKCLYAIPEVDRTIGFFVAILERNFGDKPSYVRTDKIAAHILTNIAANPFARQASGSENVVTHQNPFKTNAVEVVQNRNGQLEDKSDESSVIVEHAAAQGATKERTKRKKSTSEPVLENTIEIDDGIVTVEIASIAASVAREDEPEVPKKKKKKKEKVPIEAESEPKSEKLTKKSKKHTKSSMESLTTELRSNSLPENKGDEDETEKKRKKKIRTEPNEADETLKNLSEGLEHETETLKKKKKQKRDKERAEVQCVASEDESEMPKKRKKKKKDRESIEVEPVINCNSVESSTSKMTLDNTFEAHEGETETSKKKKKKTKCRELTEVQPVSELVESTKKEKKLKTKSKKCD